MPSIRHRVLLCLGLVVSCILFCHCSARPPGTLPPESELTDPLAEGLLQTVLSANSGLDAIKGMGRVKLRLDNQLNSFRAVWGGRQPDRFRLDILMLTGQPVISFACDGKLIYLLSYSDNKLYRRKATGNGLKRIIDIDITVADFLDLICGRLPIRRGGGARLVEDGQSGPLLVLDGRGRDFIDTISLDSDRRTPREFERREQSGKLLYRVVFESWGETDGFRLPDSITIQDDGGRMIHIDTERAWANPGLTDDKFVLNVS